MSEFKNNIEENNDMKSLDKENLEEIESNTDTKEKDDEININEENLEMSELNEEVVSIYDEISDEKSDDKEDLGKFVLDEEIVSNDVIFINAEIDNEEDINAFVLDEEVVVDDIDSDISEQVEVVSNDFTNDFEEELDEYELIDQNSTSEGLQTDNLEEKDLHYNSEENDGIVIDNNLESLDVNTYTQEDLEKLQNIDNFRTSALDHIFNGEINRYNQVGGYHYEGIADSPGSIVEGTKSEPDENGVYTGVVEVNGVQKQTNDGKSTFFPEQMSPQEVVDSINEAYDNRESMNGNTYVGSSNNGLTVVMYLDRDDKIISAFPGVLPEKGE